MAVQRRRWTGIRLLVGIAFLAVALLVGLFFHLADQEEIQRLLERVDELGMWAGIAFTALVVVEVLLLLPGLIFTLAAGFFFGVLLGSVFILTGSILGAAIAYGIGRFLLGEWAMGYVLRNPRMRLVNENLRNEGWRFIMCTRLVPFFPFKLSNYAFGVVHFPFWPFIIGSGLGNIPLTILNVYIGSLAANLAAIDEENRARPSEQWMFYAAILLLAAGAVWYLTRMARRTLQPFLEPEPKSGGPA